MCKKSMIHSGIVIIVHYSNTFDDMTMLGYEGDASDAEDDAAASAVSTGSCSSTRFPVLQMALLDFWLILRQELDKVHVFFQTRFVDFNGLVLCKQLSCLFIFHASRFMLKQLNVSLNFITVWLAHRFISTNAIAKFWHGRPQWAVEYRWGMNNT